MIYRIALTLTIVIGLTLLIGCGGEPKVLTDKELAYRMDYADIRDRLCAIHCETAGKLQGLYRALEANKIEKPIYDHIREHLLADKKRQQELVYHDAITILHKNRAS